MTGIAGQRLIRFRIEDYGIIVWMNKIDFLKENKNRLFENYFKGRNLGVGSCIIIFLLNFS